MAEFDVTVTQYRDENREARLALYRQTADGLVDALVGILTERDKVQPDDLKIDRDSAVRSGAKTRPVYAIRTPSGGPRVQFYFRNAKTPSRPLDLVSCCLECNALGVAQEFKPRKNQLDLLTIATRLVQVWREHQVKRQQRIAEQEEARRQETERTARIIRHRLAGDFLLENVARWVGVPDSDNNFLDFRWARYLPGLYLTHHEIGDPPVDHVETVDLAVDLTVGFSDGIVLADLTRALVMLNDQVPPDVTIRVWSGGTSIMLSCTLTLNQAMVMLPVIKYVVTVLRSAANK